MYKTWQYYIIQLIYTYIYVFISTCLYIYIYIIPCNIIGENTLKYCELKKTLKAKTCYRLRNIVIYGVFFYFSFIILLVFFFVFFFLSRGFDGAITISNNFHWIKKLNIYGLKGAHGSVSSRVERIISLSFFWLFLVT